MLMHIREKYSGGPNFRAAWARGKTKKIRTTRLKDPPIKDPKADIPKAGPARPFFAIWYPSRQVTTEDGSPGILTRMEVVEPPYIAP
jgi:hypothetical protein